MISIAVENILFSEFLVLFHQPKTLQNLINNQTYAGALRLQAIGYVRASARMNPHQLMWMTNKYEY